MRSVTRKLRYSTAISSQCPQPYGFYQFAPPSPETFTSVSDKLKVLPLTTIVDALWTLKYPHCMVHGIQKMSSPVVPLTTNHVGLAITLRFVPFRNDLLNRYKPKGQDSPEYFAFNMVKQESEGYKYAIVMETVGPYESIGGDIKLSMLKNNANLSCIVCDGGLRDVETVRDYNIAIYASSLTCKQGPATQIPWSVNEVVSLNGDVLCAPYDYVVADDYNVVMVPQCNVEQVIKIADIREMIEEVIKMEVDVDSDNTFSSIPNYYPFPTPVSQDNHPKLVELLDKHNKWKQIHVLQQDVFGS